MKWVEKYRGLIIEIISLLFILLFVYAAVSKLLDFEDFKIQLKKSPLLSAFAYWIVWIVPSIEIMVSIFLIIPRFKLFGFYASLSLMTLFTTYIVLVLNFTENVPCSCGGILENLNWREHMVFNIFFILASILGILISSYQGRRRLFL